MGDTWNGRPLEPQFVLVYGRTSEFDVGGGHANPKPLRMKRDSQRGEREFFITFDSLRPRHDHANSLTATIGPNGVRPFAFSPLYETSPAVGDEALALGDPTDALTRSVMMTADRKAYIAKRWDYWADIEMQRRNAPKTEIYVREMSTE